MHKPRLFCHEEMGSDPVFSFTGSRELVTYPCEIASVSGAKLQVAEAPVSFITEPAVGGNVFRGLNH